MNEAILAHLLSPEVLAAFDRFCGSTDDEQLRRADEIARAFEEAAERLNGEEHPAGMRSQDVVTLIATALTGPEPDVEAWLTAIAAGNFELRPDTVYARAPGKGSPSRFLLRQRECIERYTRGEADEADIAALRQSLHLLAASVLLRQLRDACGARAAVGIAWPVMIACHDHLSDKQRSILRHFGGRDEFHRLLAKAVSAALTDWIDSTCHGQMPPILARTYRNGLPPGVDAETAVDYLRKEDRAVDVYRNALWTALGVDGEPKPICEAALDVDDIAKCDAATLAAQLGNGPPARRYRFFLEANDEWSTPTDDERSRLHALLPALRGEKIEGISIVHRRAVLKDIADRRAAARRASPTAFPDQLLQEEIERYVTDGLPPPLGLTPQNAIYFEQESCRVLPDDLQSEDRWKELGLDDPLTIALFGRRH